MGKASETIYKLAMFDMFSNQRILQRSSTRWYINPTKTIESQLQTSIGLHITNQNNDEHDPELTIIFPLLSIWTTRLGRL